MVCTMIFLTRSVSRRTTLGPVVHIYCVLANDADANCLDSNKSIVFYIDHQRISTHFRRSLADKNKIQDPSSLIYRNTSLKPGPHTFRMESGRLRQKALVLLDYLKYACVI